jgi:hypothetical protein
MRCLRWLFILCGCINSVSAVEVIKEGLIPTYIPYDLGAMMLFLPYDPKVIIAGDKIANIAIGIAGWRERSTIFCFSSEFQDFTMLKEHAESLPNIQPRFGLFHWKPEGFYRYYATISYEQPYEDFCKFAGSFLKPIDKTRPFLFGEKRLLQAFSLPGFCNIENLPRVDLIYLNCGGHELQILQTDPELVKNAIIVCVKTYHKQIRKNLSDFKALNKFMVLCDFELMSHYIYDNVIGDALYIKRKYLSAVFRSKEL